jgi:hypothetical protein
MRVTVTINGTSTNRYKELWGLKQNPFPMVAIFTITKANIEYDRVSRAFPSGQSSLSPSKMATASGRRSERDVEELRA